MRVMILFDDFLGRIRDKEEMYIIISIIVNRTVTFPPGNYGVFSVIVPVSLSIWQRYSLIFLSTKVPRKILTRF